MQTAADLLRWKRLAVQVAALGAIWAAALLAAAVWWAGESFWGLVAGLGAPLWGAAFALFALNHLLRFVRWHWMLREEGYRVPLWRSISAFLAGLALLPTPAKAGVAVRSLLLLREGVPVSVSLAAYFSERLFDLLGLVAMAAFALGDAQATRWLIALTGCMAVVASIRLGPRVCRRLALRFHERARVQATLEWARHFLEHASRLLAGRFFFPYLALGLVANIATAALLWLTLSTLAAPIDMADAVGILGISHLSGSLSFLPAGLGGFEVAMLALLSARGIPAAAAIAALAIVRIATVWGSVAVGLPLLARRLR